MMKEIRVELDIRERMLLLQYIPVRTEGVLTARIAADLREKLLPSNEEREEWEIKEHQEGRETRMTWGMKYNTSKMVPFNKAEIGMIRKELRSMDEDHKKEFPIELIPLWDKFVERVNLEEGNGKE